MIEQAWLVCELAARCDWLVRIPVRFHARWLSLLPRDTRGRYPSNVAIRTRGLILIGSLLAGCPAALAGTYQTERKQDAQSLAADPQFLSPDNGDWRLRPESPARPLDVGSSARSIVRDLKPGITP